MESTDSNSLSSLVSSIDNKIAGVANEVDDKLDTAISTLFAEDGEVRSSISTMVQDEVSNITLSADSVDIEQDGKVVAKITNEGRCEFNNNRVYIPTTVRGIDGTTDNNASGIIVKEVSGGNTTGKLAYY